MGGETCSTHFEDTLPKPYQEFKDIFTKESFDELLDWKKWEHAIELVPNSQEVIQGSHTFICISKTH